MTTALKLPNYTNAPPGQWRYVVPETGQSFGPYPDLDSLITNLRAHYTANGYRQPSDLLPLIEQHICLHHPDYCVKPDGTESGFVVTPTGITVRKALRVTFHTVLAGTKRLLGIPTSVSQEQAESRARVCATGGPDGGLCPFNVPREDCIPCRLAVLRDMVTKIVGTRKTSYDSQLQVCKGCFCELKAKVAVPLADLDKLTTEEERAELPGYCWQLTERTTNPI